MDRPAKVKIGPHLVSIVNSEIADEEWGYFQSHTQTIGLCETFPSETIEAETMLHELSHAVWWLMQLKEGDDEERIASAFGMGFAAILKDNPALLDWLRAKLK